MPRFESKIDVRSEAEYSGAMGYPCDARQGHIPGAVNLDVNVLASLDREALLVAVGAPAGAAVIAYCHSGARSAQAVAALTTAGYAARNYTGSWHEWSADPALPIAR